MAEVAIEGKDCTINKTVKILQAAKGFSTLQHKIGDFMRGLDTNRELRHKITKDVESNKLLSNVIDELLVEWVSRKSKEATVNVLINILDHMELRSCSEPLKKLLSDTQPKHQLTCEKYSTTSLASVVENSYVLVERCSRYNETDPNMPNDALRFVVQGPAAGRILSTADCNVTLENIKKNLPLCVIYNGQQVFIANEIDIHNLYPLYIKPNDIKESSPITKDIPDKVSIEFEKKYVFITELPNTTPALLFSKAKFYQIGIHSIQWNDLKTEFRNSLRANLEDSLCFELPNNSVHKILSGKVLADIIRGEDPNLFKTSYNKQLPCWVNRNIFTRERISSTILSSNSPDIFLVDGIQLNEFLSLGYTGDCSTTQVYQPKLTARNIVLDRKQHFSRICKKTTNSVHWLHFANNEVIWIKTRGNLKILQDNVSKSHRQIAHAEKHFEDLMSREVDRFPICICGDNGTGKSILLAKIRNTLLKKYMATEGSCKYIYWKRLILELDAKELIKNLQGHSQFDIAEVISAIANLACKNVLGEAYLTFILHGSDKLVELLIDDIGGIDESEQMVALHILKLITKIKCIRIWMTARPHLLEQIENILGVFAYVIKPFNAGDQLSFTQSYLPSNCENMDEVSQNALVMLSLH